MPYQDFNPRSHKGSDGIITVIQIGRVISIHAPTRGATCFPLISLSSLSISIHAPTRGATGLYPDEEVMFEISIHAPTRGATFFRAASFTISIFQSTLPQGERPWPPCSYYANISISIHAPTRGATLKRLLSSTRNIRFQSTLPQGERLTGISKTRRNKAFQSTLPQGERQIKDTFSMIS